ncbi:MAG TPA: YceI family protein [Candidatus Limnocylindria bacterium]|jgi:polyisoprenoid-binding protein YceI
MAKWYIDPSHSSVTFGVKHMMVATVRGKLGKLQGELDFDPKAPAQARIRATIDVSTIDTNDPKRDGHLKSPDFFDVAQYPEITFRSTQIEPKGAQGSGQYAVRGDLSIRGTTKPVSFDAVIEGIAADTDGGQHLGAAGTLVIDRTQWGLVWNQPLANGVLVGDKVTIELGLAALDAATARKYGLVPAAAA